MRGRFCLITDDFNNDRVVFEERQRILHASKRPELRDFDFIDGRLKQAIDLPNFIYEDCEKPKERQVRYLEEYRANNKIKYTKVVLAKNGENCFLVITAYRPDYVKERGKTKLLYGNDN